MFLLLTSTFDHARPSISVRTIQSLSIRQNNHGERSQIAATAAAAAAAAPCFNKVSTNSLLGNFQTGPETHPASYSVSTGGSFRGDKAAEASSCSPPSSADVQNEWTYTSAPLYALMAWTEKTLPYLPKYGLYENSSSGRRHHTCWRADVSQLLYESALTVGNFFTSWASVSFSISLFQALESNYFKFSSIETSANPVPAIRCAIVRLLSKRKHQRFVRETTTFASRVNKNKLPVLRNQPNDLKV